MSTNNIVNWIEDIREESYEITDISIKDEVIVRYLNKGLEDVISIISRKIPRLLSKEEVLLTEAGVTDYPFPKTCLSRRVTLIEAQVDNTYTQELTERLESDITHLKNLNSSTVPLYYVIYGNIIKVFPTPSSPGVLNIHFTEEHASLSKPFGTITNILNGTDIYVDTLSVQDSNENYILAIGDKITITNSLDSTNDYSFRVESFDTVNNYIRVWQGLSGLTLSTLNQTNRTFTFANSPAGIAVVKSGDELTVVGSTGNDGVYSVIGVDTTTFTIYVREPIVDATVDGTFNITSPLIVNGKNITTDARVLNPGDLICKFNTTGMVTLPKIVQNYITHFALIKVLKQLKEPINDELLELQRLSQEIETMPSARIAGVKFRCRSGI